MKTFNTDKILETKIRIYNTYHLKRLKVYYDKHQKEFPTRNDFLVSLIMEGLDNFEKYDKDKNYEFDDMLQKLMEERRERKRKKQSDMEM